jgi:hypothetical protein
VIALAFGDRVQESAAMANSTVEKMVPLVVCSRQNLIEQGKKFVAPGGVAPATLPITSDGATYSMAQEITWIDQDSFAVGRWDGSLSIFAYNPSASLGPLITTSASSPSMEGVQMVQWLAHKVFASLNDEGTMLVWKSANGTWKDLKQVDVLSYEPSLGVTNSADSFRIGAVLYLVAGHANGFVTIWSGKPNGADLERVATVDVRSAKPVNPWGLHNVRGVACFQTTSDTRVTWSPAPKTATCASCVCQTAPFYRPRSSTRRRNGVSTV